MGNFFLRAIVDANMVLVLLSLRRRDALPVAYHSPALDNLEAGDLIEGTIL